MISLQIWLQMLKKREMLLMVTVTLGHEGCDCLPPRGIQGLVKYRDTDMDRLWLCGDLQFHRCLLQPSCSSPVILPGATSSPEVRAHGNRTRLYWREKKKKESTQNKPSVLRIVRIVLQMWPLIYLKLQNTSTKHCKFNLKISHEVLLSFGACLMTSSSCFWHCYWNHHRALITARCKPETHWRQCGRKEEGKNIDGKEKWWSA